MKCPRQAKGLLTRAALSPRSRDRRAGAEREGKGIMSHAWFSRDAEYVNGLGGGCPGQVVGALRIVGALPHRQASPPGALLLLWPPLTPLRRNGRMGVPARRSLATLAHSELQIPKIRKFAQSATTSAVSTEAPIKKPVDPLPSGCTCSLRMRREDAPPE